MTDDESGVYKWTIIMSPDGRTVRAYHGTEHIGSAEGLVPSQGREVILRAVADSMRSAAFPRGGDDG